MKQIFWGATSQRTLLWLMRATCFLAHKQRGNIDFRLDEEVEKEGN